MSAPRYIQLINMGGDHCGMGLATDYPDGHEDAATRSRADDSEWIKASDHDDVVRELVAVLARVSRYLPSDTVRCRGDKCREPWCISCCGEEAAEAYMEVVRADAAVLAKIAQEG